MSVLQTSSPQKDGEILGCALAGSTKPFAIPLLLIAAECAGSAAIDVDRRHTRVDRHIDFEDISPPNLAIHASSGKEDAMKATLRRTKSFSIGTPELVEVDRNELFASRSFQISQIPRSNTYCIVHAEKLRRFERLVNNRRKSLQPFIR